MTDQAIGERTQVFADAGDDGFRFIMPAAFPPSSEGGLARDQGSGHFVTIVGRGGTGKSFLALQLTTHLLKREEETHQSSRQHSAFYFTLEATPRELVSQLERFDWGKKRGYEPLSREEPNYSSRGLNIVSIPSPVASLTTLDLEIRQTIARKLSAIGRIVAIVIDPLGGVSLGDDLRTELSQLKDLASTHGTFLFLLAEDHIYERVRSIEHFSQSIIHLEHDPRGQPPRHLYIQKARTQVFRPGYHQFELHAKRGVTVFPSLQAQSAYAHELVSRVNETPSAEREPLFQMPALDEKSDSVALDGRVGLGDGIERGSVVFLMGPPGTFKQLIATRFLAEAANALRLYISFKVDVSTVTGNKTLEEAGATQLTADLEEIQRDQPRLFFLDARSPLLTPEEILFRVQRAIIDKPSGAKAPLSFNRAVVWGLRRLSDLPNFGGVRAVQFLEALVTLLKSQAITALLVDWPDPEKASTLPIVDLSQYILLTRVCRNADDTGDETRLDEEERKARKEMMEWLWMGGNVRREHVALVRVQRTRTGLHRNLGAMFFRHAPAPDIGETAPDVGMRKIVSEKFERYWLKAGMKWEQDPGLVH